MESKSQMVEASALAFPEDLAEFHTAYYCESEGRNGASYSDLAANPAL